MDINNYKTMCCKSGFTRKGRAHYNCNACGKDVTMELVFLIQADEESKILKQKNKDARANTFKQN